MRCQSGGSHGAWYISQTLEPPYNHSPYGRPPLEIDVIDSRTVAGHSIPGCTPPAYNPRIQAYTFLGPTYNPLNPGHTFIGLSCSPQIGTQDRGTTKPEPKPKSKSGPTQKFTTKLTQSPRTPIRRRQMINRPLLQGKLPQPLVSQIDTAAPSHQAIAPGETAERLIAEQKHLLAQLAEFEAQGYTAHLAENNETPSQNISFNHGESEEIEEILSGMIDENYVLRIRLQAVNTIKRDGIRAGLPIGVPGAYRVFFSGYKLICTFPADRIESCSAI